MSLRVVYAGLPEDAIAAGLHAIADDVVVVSRLAVTAELAADVLLIDAASEPAAALALLAALTAAAVHTPVIVLTASADDATALAALAAGAVDFVPVGADLAARLPARIRGAALRATRDRGPRATEQRFRSLFEHSPVCLWEEDGSELAAYLDTLRATGITDMRAYLTAHPDEVARCLALIKVLDVNQAALAHYDARDKAELIEGLGRTLTAASYTVFTEQLIALATGQTVFEAETTDRSFSGRINHTLIKTLVAPGSERSLSKVYVSITDITARKHAEARVRTLAAFPELNPNPVLQLAGDGTLTYANPAALLMSQSFGISVTDLLPAAVALLVASCLTSGRPQLGLETKRDARTLSWAFYPIAGAHTVHCYVIDITERQRLEEHLREAQRLDAIGSLAGGIAHDFNNLLTVIHGNTALLQRGRGGPELRVGALDGIAKATERAADLVRQLLAFSRRQPLQRRAIDVNAIVRDLVGMFERVVRADIRVTVELHAEPLVTRADGGMLDQVVMNLVVNARDAMPDGGALALATSVTTVTGAGLATAPELAPGRYGCLRVADTGCGIAPEHLGRIFEPFFTTKAPGHGTGLGLATVFGIVKQHGGAIAVVSEPGRGTTFTVLLPLLDDPAAVADDEIAPPTAEADGGNESILVVDDEPAVRELLQHVLESHGYRVRGAGNGAEALAAAEAERFDLVLTDVIMPGISGRELADRLCARLPGLRVIFMSGYTGEVAGRDLELRDGINFLHKPFGPVPLLACVRGCLEAAPR